MRIRNRITRWSIGFAALTVCAARLHARARIGRAARVHAARAVLLGLLVVALGACLDGDENATPSARSSALAVSAGGVTVDVVTTNVWQGGFNAAVRVENDSFSAPITSFQVVFRLGGSASIPGQAWNGGITPPDGGGSRTASNPSWLVHDPIEVGQTWDVGFTGSGTFAGATISGLVMNGQTIPIDGGGDDDGGDGSDDGGDGTDDGSDGGDGTDDGGDGSDDGGDGGGDGGKFVGNITTSGQVRSDFIQYWDQITPENEGKWGSVEATRDVMNWGPLDAVYDYAQQNGIPFKQHTLVWGSQFPSWITSLSPADQAAEVEEWIREFCQRYPSTALIDVVNEPPPHTTPPFINAIGGPGQTGYDWIIWSFQKTRQYCPNAILILNDYNVLRWDTDRFISIVNAVKGSGFIDAIGAQGHGLETQSFGELQTNLNKLITQIGLPIYVSEYDIDLADDTGQRNVMAQQFTLFWNTPQIVGITLWGYIHGSTWRPNTGLIRNGVPRPAMTWLMDFLGR
jgi:endo-1,4-beta-xylanase